MANTGASGRLSSAPQPASGGSPMRRLYVQILIAIVIGILLGHFYPHFAVMMKPFSDGFIMLIRAVVPLDHLCHRRGRHRQNGRHAPGRRRRIARDHLFRDGLDPGAVHRARVGNLLQPGAGLHINPATLDDKPIEGYVAGAKSLTIVELLMKMIPHNMVGAIAEGEILPVLVMGVLFGFALCHMGRARRAAGVADR